METKVFTNVVLQRLTTNENGTFGVLIVNERPAFVTLELPWKDNQTDVSCIPVGTYKAELIHSPRFKKDLYVLNNVPDRSMVEIHIGNTINDTHGCILLGTQYSLTQYGIIGSVLAFNSFMGLVPKSGFDFTVHGMPVSSY